MLFYVYSRAVDNSRHGCVYALALPVPIPDDEKKLS